MTESMETLLDRILPEKTAGQGTVGRQPDIAAAPQIADGLLACLDSRERAQWQDMYRALKDQAEGYLGESAEAFCRAFFARLPRIRELLATDLQAACAGDPAAACPEEVQLCYPGYRAVGIYRLAHELYRLGLPLLPRMMTEYAHSVTGIDIHPGARIGPYFFIDHGTGTVIGETAVLGAHVKLYQGVTLGGISTRGGRSLRGKKRHPTLEDNVTVYANATVLGGDTVIGQDCVIGAGVQITASVPPGTTVAAGPQALEYKKTGVL